VRADLFAAADIIEKVKVPRTQNVSFKIDYVAEAYP
jgi:hypothetical protein